MTIAVIGVGLIGGSIGLAARERLGATVRGFDAGDGVLDRALERGAVDRACATVAEAVEGADTAFVAVPVGTLPAAVGETLAAAGPECVVSDVGSTKRDVVAAHGDSRFVGGHPVAGAESAGVEHARADLFDAATWYLTPTATTSGILYERLHRVIADLGAVPAAIDAATHDRLLANVSHLPHVLANVLVMQAASVVTEGEPLPRTGPSFRDMTRVAGANSDIWTGIYVTNRDAIAREVDGVVEQLKEVATALRSADAGALREWNDAAREDRRRMLEAGLEGAGTVELRLSVPNRPGIVAQVALALGRARVNIADMALAPAADMRSGSMTLWVAGEDDAVRAKHLIEDLGFPTAVVDG
jgi:prephenate dehydrogenase